MEALHARLPSSHQLALLAVAYHTVCQEERHRENRGLDRAASSSAATPVRTYAPAYVCTYNQGNRDLCGTDVEGRARADTWASVLRGRRLLAECWLRLPLEFRTYVPTNVRTYTRTYSVLALILQYEYSTSTVQYKYQYYYYVVLVLLGTSTVLVLTSSTRYVHYGCTYGPCVCSGGWFCCYVLESTYCSKRAVPVTDALGKLTDAPRVTSTASPDTSTSTSTAVLVRVLEYYYQYLLQYSY